MEALLEVVKELPTEVLSILTFIAVIVLAWERIAPWLGLRRIGSAIERPSEHLTLEEVEKIAREKNGVVRSLTNEVQSLTNEIRLVNATIVNNKKLSDREYEFLHDRLTRVENRVNV